MRPESYLSICAIMVVFLILLVPHASGNDGSNGPATVLRGRIVYEGGPNTSMPASGAVVILIDEDTSEVASSIANISGHYLFENVTSERNYTIKATPRSEMLGILDSYSGYLENITNVFVEDDLETVQDIELAYHLHVDPTPLHPRIRILDREGEGLSGVEVIAETSTGSHSAVTGIDGWAVFEDITGATLPPGTELSASREGYRTIRWTHGDPVPPMGKERKDDTLLVIVLLLLTFSSVAILVILGLKGRDRQER
ncbi:MAG: carboxypeptidase-like regulatory domain-containing protein [Candidatus Thermoplasmatota archaeon]|nr:carboxypeptidase-like regulatory domain-containing protein [Candidatus Thermoplasmatota archaeon]